MTTTPVSRRPPGTTSRWLADHHVTVLLLSAVALFPFSKAHQLPLAILGIIGLVRVVSGTVRVRDRPELRLFLLVHALIFVPLLISLPGAADMEKAVGTTARYVAIFFMGIAVLAGGTGPRAGVVLLWGIVMLASLWMLDALVQYATGTNVLGYPAVQAHLTGMFYPALSIGIFLAHLAPFYLEALRRLSPSRPWVWLLIIPYTAVILLSGSRSAWLVLVLALVVFAGYMAICHKVAWKRILLLGTAVAIVGLLTTLYSPGLQDRMDRTSGLLTLDMAHWNHATSERVGIWVAAGRVFREHWVTGVGARGFTSTAMDTGLLEQEFSHVHLFVLEIAVATGAIGLICYVLILGMLLRGYLRLGSLRTHLFAPWLAVGLALFPFNAHWHFYGTFFTSLLWVILLVTLIMSRETGPASGFAGKEPVSVSP